MQNNDLATQHDQARVEPSVPCVDGQELPRSEDGGAVISCENDLPWELCDACKGKVARRPHARYYDVTERCGFHPNVTHELICTTCQKDQQVSDSRDSADIDRENANYVAKAEARLHDAASEMYRALQLILERPYGCPQCHSGKLIDPVNKEHWDYCGFMHARAVIAKVEGR